MNNPSNCLVTSSLKERSYLSLNEIPIFIKAAIPPPSLTSILCLYTGT